MAGTCNFSSHVTGSSLEPRIIRPAFPSFHWKIPRKSSCAFASSNGNSASLAEGPSCIFVGPLETANQELLEALYRQARDSYYSGKPLIVDDMFDKVELKLRWYGSKSVVKYPRCSLRRQSTYADAEVKYPLVVGQEDPSQILALGSVWILLLAFGILLLIVPTLYAVGLAYHDAINTRFSLYKARSVLEFLPTASTILYMVLGSVIGYPIASASVRSLQGLWRHDLVGLKGSCPNCGEEVFAFVPADRTIQSLHRADCHVCECTLEFRTKVEQSISRPRRRWVYGRVYLVRETIKRRRWR
ncbi:hypothetical protein ACLOJK_012811 [Asimina triloba]